VAFALAVQILLLQVPSSEYLSADAGFAVMFSREAVKAVRSADSVTVYRLAQLYEGKERLPQFESVTVLRSCLLKDAGTLEAISKLVLSPDSYLVDNPHDRVGHINWCGATGVPWFGIRFESRGVAPVDVVVMLSCSSISVTRGRKKHSAELLQKDAWSNALTELLPRSVAMSHRVLELCRQQ
jgi:hypothetical protein